jgi:hypothetical protein
MIDACSVGGITITHKSQQLSKANGDKVIESLGYNRGYVVVVEGEAPPKPKPRVVFDKETTSETES